jgi:hypothetical protein
MYRTWRRFYPPPPADAKGFGLGRALRTCSNAKNALTLAGAFLMTNKLQTHRAACHCGAVQFDVRLLDGLNTVSRCNCSFCRMRGAIVVSAPLDGIRFVKGEEILTLYQFNSRTAKHYFCSVCGIYTHHQRRSDPNQFGINVACLAGVSPFDFAEIPVSNGVNHPSDGANGPTLAGILSFSRA